MRTTTSRKNWPGLVAGAALLSAASGLTLAQTPAGTMNGMDHGSMPGMDHSSMPGMDHSSMQGSAPASEKGMDHGSMQEKAPASNKSMDHGSMKGMDHGSMKGMDHGSMPGMDHSSMPGMGEPSRNGPPVGSLPSSDGSTEQRYAAYRIHPHMMDNVVTSHLLFDKLGVAYDRNEQTSLQWDGQFWIGRDLNKLWIKSEGDRLNGSTDAKIEAFWSHTISPFWDLQLGARRDFGTGPKRNWAAFGVQGVAPYGIETEITGYVGGSGRTALALKAEYDLLLTQRLILTPEIEASLYGKNDEARGVGSGLSDASFSLRLRYEVTREFAPYVGVSFGRKFGQTASYASEAGESRSERAILAGVRIWF